MKLSQDISAIAKALTVAQSKIEKVGKGKSGYGYKYAELGAVVDAALPVLNANGIAVLQPTSTVQDGVIIETVLMHESGQWISGELFIPAIGGKQMNAAQALGSAITYGRRYGLAAMLGIAPEDDDAHAAGVKGQQQRQQAKPHASADDKRKSAEAYVEKTLKAWADLFPADQEEFIASNKAMIERIQKGYPDLYDKLAREGLK